MKTTILAILYLLACIPTRAQTKQLRGTVTDTLGNAMEGVSVISAGSKVGTTTRKDGTYYFDFPANTKTILFSFVGYQTVTRAVENLAVIDVQLKQSASKMDEVVMVAAGLEKARKDLGYSVGVLNNDELTVARTSNIVNALSGKIPGVRITGTNGMAGSSASIFIRGFNTITGSNQPLFVVDGIPVDNGGGSNALQSGVTLSNRGIDLNQDDIETITVLKGPAAAVLYGSRAASGAIIITSKKGHKGQKISIQFNSTTQFVNVNRYPDYQNQYAQGASKNSNPNPADYALFNPNSTSSWGPIAAGQTVVNFDHKNETLQTFPDNAKEIFRQGINVQNNLSLSGGSEKMTYRLSIGNLYENGVVNNNNYVRTNISFAGTAKITDKLSSGIDLQYINSNSQRIQQGNQASNAFFSNWYLPRSMNVAAYPYENSKGEQVYYTANADNPLWTIQKNLWNDYINRIIGNINFKYDINSSMNITYKLGTDFYNQYISAFDEIGARGPANTNAGGTGGVLETNSNFSNYYSYLNFNFKHTFGKLVDAKLVVGNEASWQGSRFNQGIGRGLAVAGFNNLGNASSFIASNGVTNQLLVGVYADLGLDYNGIVSLNLAGRNDWSSTFSQQQRSYFYPSVAAAVNLTQAIPAWRNNTLLSFAKLFANYAKVGKEAAPYANNALFERGGATDGSGSTISFPFNGLPAFSFSNIIGDSTLGPEFTSSVELGTEISLWKNRISLQAAWYKSKSTDIIFGALYPFSTGFNYYTINAGELQTNGWEFALSVTPVLTKSFSWTTTFNFTRYKTMCTKLADGVKVLALGGIFSANARMQVGSPYGVLYGTVYNRDRSTGELLLNNQGQTTASSSIAQIGDPNPDWLLGFVNEFTYKGFNLNFLIDIKKGGDVYSRDIGDLRRTGTAKETAEFSRFEADGITPNKPYIIEGIAPDGRPNTVPLTAEQYYGNLYGSGVSELSVFDASWIRLRELQFGYIFSKGLNAKKLFQGMEVGVLGRNLYLYAPNYPHFDPENNVFGVNNIQGLEFNGLPGTRSFGFYIKLILER